MKKIYLFVKGAKRWNSLLNKFSKLHKRLQLLLNSDNATKYNKLVNKLQSVYSKLEKMQYQTGIKVASTSLALILFAFTANAQFAAGQLLQVADTIDVINRAAPTFADIDGDGDLDLYVGNSDGLINVFTNNGSGGFTTVSNLQAGGANIDIGTNSVPTFADIDGDGDLDLYAAQNYGTIYVFNNNNGDFTPASFLQAGGTGISEPRPAQAFADIDGDGDLDLYVGDYSGAIKVFTNNGSGSFTAVSDLQAGGVNIDLGPYSAPAFADIDGDGDLDLYVGDYSGAVKVFTNNGSGSFTAASDLQASGTIIDVGSISKPTFADIDSDGDLDLYIGNFSGNIKVFTNNGGVFTAANSDLQALRTDIDVGNYPSPTFADIDSDGDLDLYVGENYGAVKVFTFNNGIFNTGLDLQVGGTTIDIGNFAAPIFEDIDGDGDLDLYVGEYDGAIKVFTNGGFTSVSDLQADGSNIDVGFISKPTFADIDSDGDLDLYVGEYYGIIKVFTNNSGVFTATTDLQIGGTNIDIGFRAAPTFADIDGDGDLDLYVGERYGTIKVFTNNAGVFTAVADLQAGGTNIDVGTFSAPTFADIDGDGDLDLYVGERYGTITFFENTSIVGINDLAFQNLSVYPNPSSNWINLNVSEELSSIRMMDMTGKTVKVFNSESRKLDIFEFTTGIYFLEIANSESKSIVKIIKN